MNKMTILKIAVSLTFISVCLSSYGAFNWFGANAHYSAYVCQTKNGGHEGGVLYEKTQLKNTGSKELKVRCVLPLLTNEQQFPHTPANVWVRVKDFHPTNNVRCAIRNTYTSLTSTITSGYVTKSTNLVNQYVLASLAFPSVAGANDFPNAAIECSLPPAANGKYSSLHSVRLKMKVGLQW